MAFSYGFYNSYNGDRKYNPEQISAIFDGIIKDGVFDSIGELFATVPGDGLQVIVKSGKAWFDHTWAVNDSWYPINLEAGDVTRDRIDAVVLETDHTQENRKSSLKIVTGNPSALPSKPLLAKTELINQHPLAYVTVRANAIQITSSDIEICVGFESKGCPYVTGILETASIDSLFGAWAEQFQNFLNTKEQNYEEFLEQAQLSVNNWIADTQNRFQAWWDIVLDTLDTDTAAKLQQQILDNKADADKKIGTALDFTTTNLSSEVSTLKTKTTNLESNKQNKITSIGVLKGLGNGNIGVASRGVDYDTSGATTWKYVIITETQDVKIPSNIINPCHVMMMGAGGGGAAIRDSYVNGAGGGSGYFVDADVNVTPGATVKVTIGAGGKGGTASRSSDYPGTNGTNSWADGFDGGDTKFGSYLTAKGGKAGRFELNSEGIRKAVGGDGAAGGTGSLRGGNGATFGGGYPNGNGGNYGGGGRPSGKGGIYGKNADETGYGSGPVSFFFRMLWPIFPMVKTSTYSGDIIGTMGGGYFSYGGVSGGGYFANGGSSDKSSNTSTWSYGGAGGIGPGASINGNAYSNGGYVPGGGGMTIPSFDYIGANNSWSVVSYRHYGFGGSGYSSYYSNENPSGQSGSSGVCVLFYRTTSDIIA